MNRPFPMSLSRQSPPGALSLRLDFEFPLGADHRLAWLDLLKTFVNLAQCGALSGSGIEPSCSGCTLQHAHVRGSEAALDLLQVRLDPAAGTVLLNLCQWAHRAFAPLRGLSLAWDGGLVAEPDPVAFPHAWPDLGFEVAEHELLGQMIAVDIEFASPQPKAARERVHAALGAWLKAAHWGGYGDELFPPERSSLVLASPPAVSDEFAISWYLDDCHCAHEVFSGLVNALQSLARRGVAIRRVSIGE